MKKIIFSVFAIVMFTLQLYSQAPNTISWQGILQDSEGNNLTGNHNLTVKLYEVATGSTAVWTETHNAVAIDNGLVNIALGSITPFNFSFDKQYWLEITVGESTPMARIKLNSVPYSLYSKKSSGIIENDSIVLKDSLGVTRMVFNPNSGTFKMMNNDTTWYEVSVESPKSEKMVFFNGSTYEKRGLNSGTNDGYITTMKDAEGNLFYEETVTSFSASGHSEEKVEKKEYLKDLNTNQYYLSEKNINESVKDFDNEIFGYIEHKDINTKEIFNNQGILISKKVNENINEIRDGKEYLDKKTETKFLYDEVGSYQGKTIITEKRGIDQNTTLIKETYIGNVIREKISEAWMAFGARVRITEAFNEQGEKISEIQEIESLEEKKKETFVKQGNQGTKVTQTQDKLTYSNSNSSNQIELSQDSYTGNFDVSAYIGGEQKRIFRVTEQGVISYGPNDNVEINQTGTSVSGSTNFTNSTQFQGNTYLNGTNYVSGNVYANGANFNGDVQVGTSGPPKNFNCSGSSTVNGNGYFGGNLDVDGNLYVEGDLSFGGNLDLSDANLVANSLKSQNDIQAKGAKKFVIDHPTDITKLIQHAAVEANQVYNFYRGNVQTNELGYATVTMPDYFLSINSVADISYQLTVIDAINFPQAVIYSEYDEES